MSQSFDRESARRDRRDGAEPIAIIGIGCRFPGGVSDSGGFWQFLLDRGDAIREIPPDRFDIEAYYDPTPATPGKVITRYGGFLEGLDLFDAAFFGISPREADRLDPQQRLLLEVAWEAVEDAGQPPDRLAGSQTGVFVGMWINDYESRLFRDPGQVDFYMTTGSGRYSASGRLSYLLGLQGPSLTVDAACSSSLVAVHLACQSLWSGECATALAGGASTILQPHVSIAYSQSRMLAPDGRCKFGDARADGYVRSEGAGVVVLKPLSRALQDADPIYALIRGSAVNNDGRTSGFLTTPGGRGQEELLRLAYRRAGVPPGQVHYVEAHGTGTRAGDPVEIQALGAVLSEERPAGRPCVLGSVKTNFGHTEGAAGVAGLIKAALCVKHRMIPASLHFQEPAPGIPWGELPVVIQRELGTWPVEDAPAVAGVSSFGISGTNAHVVLEEPPREPSPREVPSEASEACLLTLSAHSAQALRDRARALAEHVTSERPALRDLCYTASVRRAHHDHRLALVVRSPRETVEALRRASEGGTAPGMSSGLADGSHQRKLAFVFSGQGSQWFGMARELLAREPVFRRALRRCESALREHVDWSLLEQLTATEDQPRWNDIDVIQPTLFAVQVALAALWRSFGIEPDALVGHSLGEVAAAHVAGALSLEDAARVICLRSRLMRRVRGQGAMAVVGLTLDQAREELVGREDLLSIAVSNGPKSTVISGDPGALGALMEALERRDVFCALVKVDVAAHSPHMEPLRDELVQALSGLEPRSAPVAIFSTVTGQECEGAELDADYWGRNLRQPVLFSDAVRRLAERGHDIFLEMSPHPVLLPAIEEGLHHVGRQGAALPSLKREEGPEVLLGSLGALYALGRSIDWDVLYPSGGRCLRLPAHPWQRKRFWFEAAPLALPATGGGRTHPLLGRRLPDLAHVPGGRFWETELTLESVPGLEEHRALGAPVVPLAVFLEMALAIAREAIGAKSGVLEELTVHEPLAPCGEEPRTVQLAFTPGATEGQRASFRIHSRDPGGDPEWTPHAGGLLAPAPAERGDAEPRRIPPTELRSQCPEELSVDRCYQELRQRGLELGAGLRTIQELWRGDDQALCKIRLQEARTGVEVYGMHPALVETCLHVLGAAILDPGTSSAAGTLRLPTGLARFQVHASTDAEMWAHARPGEKGGLDVRWVDDSGRVLAEARGVRYGPPGPRTLSRAVRERLVEHLYDVSWEPAEHSPPATDGGAEPGLWLIFSDRSGVGESLARRLADRGAQCAVVHPGESYEDLGGGEFRVRPASREDLDRLLDKALRPEAPACRGVVHLWSLDQAPAEEATLEDLESAQIAGCAHALTVLQALLARGDALRPRQWWVTRGAQAAGREGVPVEVGQSPLWGLGRVALLEHPELVGGLLDLDPAPAESEIDALASEILEPDGEDQIAFRGRTRHVARLAPQAGPLPRGGGAVLRSDARYLITGGLGGLGLQLAGWMVEQGARHLLLTSRRGLPELEGHEAPRDDRWRDQVRAVRALEALGADVRVVRADSGDKPAMAALFQSLADGGPPLKGIVHAAGVLTPRALADLTPEDLWSVLRPKLSGAWVLHELARELDLDFFVLFSSAASVWGSKGLAHYAAANQFLDALAHHRRACGLPALSVNWGWLAGGGVVTADTGKFFAETGLEVMSTGQAFEALAALLEQDAGRKTVATVDWGVFKPVYEAKRRRPFLARIEARPGAPEGPSIGVDSDLLASLERAAPDERREMLTQHVRSQVAGILGFDTPDAVGLGLGFFKMGMDSMMTVQLRNRLEAGLGRTLPPTVAFEYPTIRDLAGYLADEVLAVESPPDAAPEPEGAAEEVEAEEELLSEEELTARLAEKLRELQ